MQNPTEAFKDNRSDLHFSIPNFMAGARPSIDRNNLLSIVCEKPFMVKITIKAPIKIFLNLFISNNFS